MNENGERIPADIRARLAELSTMPVADHVEKQVDVAIAVDLVTMAFRDQYDVAYLLSVDADFVSAVREVQRLGKIVFAAKASTERSDSPGRVTKGIPLGREWFLGLDHHEKI